MAKNDGAWATSLWRVAVDHYGDRLHRFLLRRLGRQEVDDVAQEVFVKLMRVPHNEYIQNPEAYIFSVARQVIGSFGREVKRHSARVCVDSDQVEDLMEHPEDLRPDTVAQAVIATQLLHKFLDQLPPEQAAALVLYERDGYSYAEIAAQLDTSERSVQRYLLKARDRLARLLELERQNELRPLFHKDAEHE
jgi:RNA polymerase sigma factor (sigma-70 family)